MGAGLISHKFRERAARAQKVTGGLIRQGVDWSKGFASSTFIPRSPNDGTLELGRCGEGLASSWPIWRLTIQLITPAFDERGERRQRGPGPE